MYRWNVEQYEYEEETQEQKAQREKERLLKEEHRKYAKELGELFLSYEGEKYPTSALYFRDLYEYQGTLGKGSFGQVVKAVQKCDAKIVAIKIIEKKQFKKQTTDLDKEAKILQQLDHPNIIKFLASHESSKCMIIVMEYFQGFSLDQFITHKQNNPFTDNEVKDIIKQILLAIQSMHAQEVLHRDLKPENILIREKEDHQGQFEIRVIDFGLSFKNEQIGTVSDNCGTLIYMAPEMAFNRQYHRSVDVWSCGIIQYILFTMGRHPLWNKIDSKKVFIEKLKNPKWEFPSNMSREAISFFLKTAAVNQVDRMSAQQCLKHVWVSGEGSLFDPVTMNDMIQCISKTQSLGGIIKAVIVLEEMKRRSQELGYIEKTLREETLYPMRDEKRYPPFSQLRKKSDTQTETLKQQKRSNSRSHQNSSSNQNSPFIGRRKLNEDDEEEEQIVNKSKKQREEFKDSLILENQQNSKESLNESFKKSEVDFSLNNPSTLPTSQKSNPRFPNLTLKSGNPNKFNDLFSPNKNNPETAISPFPSKKLPTYHVKKYAQPKIGENSLLTGGTDKHFEFQEQMIESREKLPSRNQQMKSFCNPSLESGLNSYGVKFPSKNISRATKSSVTLGLYTSFLPHKLLDNSQAEEQKNSQNQQEEFMNRDNSGKNNINQYLVVNNNYTEKEIIELRPKGKTVFSYDIQKPKLIIQENLNPLNIETQSQQQQLYLEPRQFLSPQVQKSKANIMKNGGQIENVFTFLPQTQKNSGTIALLSPRTIKQGGIVPQKLGGQSLNEINLISRKQRGSLTQNQSKVIKKQYVEDNISSDGKKPDSEKASPIIFQCDQRQVDQNSTLKSSLQRDINQKYSFPQKFTWTPSEEFKLPHLHTEKPRKSQNNHGSMRLFVNNSGEIGGSENSMISSSNGSNTSFYSVDQVPTSNFKGQINSVVSLRINEMIPLNGSGGQQSHLKSHFFNSKTKKLSIQDLKAQLGEK